MAPTATPTPMPAFAPDDKPGFDEFGSWKDSPGNDDVDLVTGIEAVAIVTVVIRKDRARRQKAEFEIALVCLADSSRRSP